MKHLENDPGYTLHTPRTRQIIQILQHPGLSQAKKRLMSLEARAEFERHSHPDYTCPTCRVAVSSAPTEVFNFKATVQRLGEETGEKMPEHLKRSRPAHGRSDGPWDGFFINIQI